jgi:hypothetical protein
LEPLLLQLCSQPLNGNSFAIDRLGNLFLFPVLLILSLTLFFLEMMTTLDDLMEVLVLVCSKLTPKLILWSKTHVLIWRRWKLPLTVTLTSTIQTRPLEMMFAYSVYHKILDWNHYLCSSALSHWLATVLPWTVLGTFPAVPMLLILSLPCFFYKKALTPISPPHFKLLPSSLDRDLGIWFLLLIQ